MTSPTAPKPVSCPRCNSPSIQAITVEVKKEHEPSLADILTDTDEDREDDSETAIRVVYLSCGCQWSPGSPEEQEIRAMSGQLGERAKRETEGRVAEAKKDKDRQSQGVLTIAVLLIIGVLVWLAFFYNRP